MSRFAMFYSNKAKKCIITITDCVTGLADIYAMFYPNKAKKYIITILVFEVYCTNDLFI